MKVTGLIERSDLKTRQLFETRFLDQFRPNLRHFDFDLRPWLFVFPVFESMFRLYHESPLIFSPLDGAREQKKTSFKMRINPGLYVISLSLQYFPDEQSTLIWSPLSEHLHSSKWLFSAWRVSQVWPIWYHLFCRKSWQQPFMWQQSMRPFEVSIWIKRKYHPDAD